MKLFKKKTELDKSMNKEHFVLKIKVDNKKFIGYIWPSDNWVEVHCFDELNEEIKEYDTDYKYKPFEVMGNERFRKVEGHSKIKSNWNVFGKRIHSFIIPRDKVIGDRNSISCNPTKEDYDRWNEWHTEDDYDTELWIEDLDCTWFESHGGIKFARSLNLKTHKVGDLYRVD